MGHWSAACSLKEQLEGEGHRVQTVDLFDYAMPELAPVMYRGFDLLVTYGGGVYNLIHHMTRNGAGDAPMCRELARGLQRLLDSAQPDLVLSTHPSCSGAMARLKAQGASGLPLVTCVTDVTSHAEWLQPGTNYYLVASDTVREGLIVKGADRERIVVTGIPVRAAFGGGQPRKDGVRELLIMGGGLGLMPRKDGFYEELDALPNVHTTILTGKNEKLYRRLAGKYAHIEVVGFTDRVYEYMGRAHLMLSKPGGITTFEAIAAQLPMLAWEPFLAQERENAHFLVAAGMGRVAPKEESECLSAIWECIYDDALLAGMREAMERMGRSCRPQAVGQVVMAAARETNRTAQRPCVKEAWA
jgi:UDP-N-acetylglucosamine:LPS N-acetylglucosamine transferase